MSTLSTNVNGPHLVTAALLPLLQLGQKKLIVNMYVLHMNIRLPSFA